MRTVTLSVNDQLANRLTSMSQKEVDTIMEMVQTILDDNRSLEEIVQDAQEQAKKNKLTQKKLNEILNKPK